MAKPDTLWNRNFALLWQGGAVSALGDQAYMIAIMLWTKQATESGAVVGLVMFAGAITGLIMPLGGVLADRLSKTKLLVAFDVASGSAVIVLSVTFWNLPTGHPALIPVVLAVTVVRGVCMSLFHPVVSALVPNLVKQDSLTHANSILQTTYRVTVTIGQGLGGLLFQVLGAPVLFLVDGISFLVSAISESFIREPKRADDSREQKQIHILSDLREGLRFTARLRGFRLYLLEASCVNFFVASLFVCLPFYVEDVLRVSAVWYGYLLGSMGFGAIVGGLAASQLRQPGVLRGTIHMACLFSVSTCMLPLSLVRSPWAAMAVLMIAWACVGVHQVLITTVVQKRTPAEFRGRVLGVLAMLRGALMPMGLATFGVLIDVFDGQVVAVLFWAGVASLIIIACAFLHPEYRWFFTGDEEQVAMEDV